MAKRSGTKTPKRIRSTVGELIAMAYDQVKGATRDRERAERLTALAVVRYLLHTGNLRAARTVAESAST